MPRPLPTFCLTLLLALAPTTFAKKAPDGTKPSKPNKTTKPAPTERVGLIKKVEPTQITLQTYGKVPAELVIPVDAKTQIQVNGDTATLADVKPGMEAVVSPLTGTAQKLLAQKEGKKKKDKDKKKDKTSPAPAPDK